MAASSRRVCAIAVSARGGEREVVGNAEPTPQEASRDGVDAAAFDAERGCDGLDFEPERLKRRPYGGEIVSPRRIAFAEQSPDRTRALILYVEIKYAAG